MNYASDVGFIYKFNSNAELVQIIRTGRLYAEKQKTWGRGTKMLLMTERENKKYIVSIGIVEKVLSKGQLSDPEKIHCTVNNLTECIWISLFIWLSNPLPVLEIPVWKQGTKKRVQNYARLNEAELDDFFEYAENNNYL